MDIFNKKEIKKLKRELAECKFDKIEAMATVHTMYNNMKGIEMLDDVTKIREFTRACLNFFEKDPWFRKHIMSKEDEA